jgi:hypothetical protein
VAGAANRIVAQSTESDGQHIGIDQALLSLNANFVEQDVATIAYQLLVVHPKYVQGDDEVEITCKCNNYTIRNHPQESGCREYLPLKLK